jgi:hypothetical protein
MLANPLSPDAIPEIGPVQAGAGPLGFQLVMFNASTVGDIEAAFAAIAARAIPAFLRAWLRGLSSDRCKTAIR